MQVTIDRREIRCSEQEGDVKKLKTQNFFALELMNDLPELDRTPELNGLHPNISNNMVVRRLLTYLRILKKQQKSFKMLLNLCTIK